MPDGVTHLHLSRRGDNAGNIPDFLKICAGVGIGRALYKAGKSLDEIAADADATIKAPV